MIKLLKKHVVLLLALLLMQSFLFAADNNMVESNFVVYSPLLSVSPQKIVSTEVQTFNDQLGIVITDTTEKTDKDSLLLIAISNPNYPITPGDVFSLVYKEGIEQKSLNFQIDVNYMANIPGFEAVNVRDMNLTEFRDSVTKLITTYYAFSNPQVFLTSLGNFTVTVKGEVSSTAIVPAWGLTRLSEVLTLATPYANSRSVEIKSIDGSIKYYDIFAALKLGDLTQNPLLKSGDIITLKKAARTVVLSGEVYKEGTYQINASDNLNSLINTYAGGFLTSADTTKIVVERFNKESLKNEIINVSMKDNFKLENQDIIRVEKIKKKYNSISVEGAITGLVTTGNTTTTLVGMPSGKLVYYFSEDEDYSTLIKSISGRLISSSNLQESYINRGDDKLPINLMNLLNGDLDKDIELQSGDVLVIPFDQKFVNVQGAVARASSYAYAPDKSLEYYIALAGGESDDSTGDITVYNKNGVKIDNYGVIPAESTIVVKKNNFTQNLVIATSLVTLLSTTVIIIKNIVELSK